jgi:formylglycine-generating enzyme required for sulfatase activity
MVQVGRFCIDRYEAHLRAADAEGEVHPHHRRPVEGVSYLAVSEGAVMPQGYISRVEAKAACEQAGKRLCARGEWMLACRGTASAPRPDKGRACNHGKVHLLTKLFRGGWDYERHFNSPELNLTPGFLAETGSHPECTSELGVHDMVGNLHEWVSDTVTSSFLRAFEAEGVGRQFQYVQVGNGVFMGGFYSTRGELGPGCMFTTVAHDERYHDYSTGFRCCRSVVERAHHQPGDGDKLILGPLSGSVQSTLSMPEMISKSES